ncbi:MAG: hypothetical protein HGB12_00060 [Bacteroidetes bacterium]|nr:hypothetical protein [Bacteroidota bacterium]
MKIKKTFKIAKCIIYALLIINSQLSIVNCFSQGVSINTTGNEADNSAALDISSTTQGVLMPRMTTIQRDLITSPATGLMIFNITTNCFEAYVNGAWNIVSCPTTCTLPSAAGTISGTTNVCPGQSAVLYSVPAIAGATSYIWSYSGTGAFIVGSTNAVIVYFSETTSSGNLTVTGANACGNGVISANYGIAVNPTPPSITIQPVSPTAVCGGIGAPSFTLTATGSGLAYQWQEYISSWNDVANAGVYSGATTATLTITNPSVEMNTYKYRCIVSGTCTYTTSDGIATLTVNNLPASVTTLEATGIGSHLFKANWNSSTYATSYCIDVSLNTGFSSFVTGYNNLNVGNILSYDITGLTIGTSYYYRVRAVNSCGSSGNSNTISVTTANIAANLVSYWKLDESSGNAVDAVGSNTLTNTNTATYPAGKINNGVLTNPSGDRYLIKSSPSGLSGLSDITINVWARPRVAQIGLAGTVEFGTAATAQSCGLGFTASGLCCISYSNDVYINYSYAVGSWVMYTMTIKGSTKKVNFYANGSYIGTEQTFVNTLNIGSTFCSIGIQCPASLNTFDGNIDEAGVWSRVLTTAEISALYNSGAGLQYPF